MGYIYYVHVTMSLKISYIRAQIAKWIVGGHEGVLWPKALVYQTRTTFTGLRMTTTPVVTTTNKQQRQPRVRPSSQSGR